MEFPKNQAFENGRGGFLSRNRNYFLNSKMLSLDPVLVSYKNLLFSRQVILVKKSCLIVAENVKCRNSSYIIKTRSCSNAKNRPGLLARFAKTESVAQTRKTKEFEKKWRLPLV